jgi:cell volume regulation protein A
LDELKQFRRLEKFNVDQLNKEVVKFKDLTMEGAFLVRALFFLLFGFLMKTSEILNMETFFWALGIVAMIFILRAIQLKIIRVPVMPLVFIAPRGLITILLFLTIDPVDTIPLVNTSLITQVIILTAFVMMLGLMTTGRKTPADQAHVKGDELLKQ